MPEVKINELREAREQPAAPGAEPPRSLRDISRDPGAALAAVRRAAATVAPRAVWRDHRLFAILMIAALVPRVLAALAFRPALMSADSFLYMKGANDGKLGQIRPSGYSLFLQVLQPFPHTLLAVTTAQHLMGIAVAVIVYGLLRYRGLPAWGASLAAAPVLFDTRQIALESYILPDTLFCLAIIVSVALLITKRAPGLWQCVLVGLLLAYVTLLRGNGLPVAVVAAVYLLIRRVGWRAVTAGAAAFAVPVLGYVLAFHSSYGQYNLTSSDGIFLWSRVTSFANCAIIKPAPKLAPLCPNRETSVARPGPAPAWSVPALLDAPAPADFIWASDVWWRNDAHPGFNAYNNKLGTQFALDAIKAQPLDYLRVSARDVMLVFLANDRPQSLAAVNFTTQPHIPVLPSYYANDLRAYAGTTSNTHPVEPYAYFMFLYQLPVYFPGYLLLAALVAGLAGVIRRRQWGGPAALPWAIAVMSIVLPALLTQSLYRYTMVAIPLACLAAGLAFVRPGPRHSPATASSSTSPVPGASSPTSPASPGGQSPLPEAPGAASPAPSAPDSTTAPTGEPPEKVLNPSPG